MLPLLAMDALRWRDEQRGLREAVRRERRTSDGRASLDTDPGDDARPSAGSLATTLASVIVVCWNSADVLGRCLDHLFAQDYPNREIIVVDDGSEDGTLKVAEQASTRAAMTLVRSARNRGCPSARNLGLRYARGEIVAFVDADGFVTPGWLGEVVRAFGADTQIGGVASTVFYDDNPMVLNGAGGTVNRQGWAADLSMNESYEGARFASEALYPMGCGMALRREALEHVGPFDDRMLNYYDDVDYGTRLWRAGYKVVVAADAWIDHGIGAAGGDSARKRLLCERHRMRVILKHAPANTLVRWAAHEARGVRRAPWPRRALKLNAMAWNVWQLPSVMASRRRQRGQADVPQRLVDCSWGDRFPAGVPQALTPRPEGAANRIDMERPGSQGQLIYGWFPTEQAHGRIYRWAGMRAAALVRLTVPARRLHLEYAHVPVDTGGVDLQVRRVGSFEQLTPIWGTHLDWQYIARSLENHPLALPAGDYEVVFSAREGWSEPPLRTRSLALALSRMSFEPSYEVGSGGLDMTSPRVEEQLVKGWFEPEESAGRRYRWTTRRAVVMVRLAESASGASLSYCMAPGDIGGVNITLRSIEGGEVVWSERIAWKDGDWHESSFPVQLAAGDYVLAFDADQTWSNQDQRDRTLPPENRSIGIALSSVSFPGTA
jgi:GT2 family glycosyltransferase